MIEENFGSLDEFKDKLTKSSMTFFGSGYTWLSVNPEGKMELTTAANSRHTHHRRETAGHEPRLMGTCLLSGRSEPTGQIHRKLYENHQLGGH